MNCHVKFAPNFAFGELLIAGNKVIKHKKSVLPRPLPRPFQHALQLQNFLKFPQLIRHRLFNFYQKRDRLPKLASLIEGLLC